MNGQNESMESIVNATDVSWQELVQKIDDFTQQHLNFGLQTMSTGTTSSSMHHHNTLNLETQNEFLWRELLALLLSKNNANESTLANFQANSISYGNTSDTVKVSQNYVSIMQSMEPSATYENAGRSTPNVSNSLDSTTLNKKRRRRQFSEEEMQHVQQGLQQAKCTRITRSEKTPYDNMMHIFKFK